MTVSYNPFQLPFSFPELKNFTEFKAFYQYRTPRHLHTDSRIALLYAMCMQQMPSGIVQKRCTFSTKIIQGLKDGDKRTLQQVLETVDISDQTAFQSLLQKAHIVTVDCYFPTHLLDTTSEDAAISDLLSKAIDDIQSPLHSRTDYHHLFIDLVNYLNGHLDLMLTDSEKKVDIEIFGQQLLSHTTHDEKAQPLLEGLQAAYRSMQNKVPLIKDLLIDHKGEKTLAVQQKLNKLPSSPHYDTLQFNLLPPSALPLRST